MAPSRRLQTKPAIACLKTLLLLYSLVFWVTGLVLLCVGVWGSLSLGPYLALLSEPGAEGGSSATTAPLVLMGTGAAILLFGLVGCMATCRGSPCLLKLYAVLLLTVFLAELIAGISGFIFRHEINGLFRSNLKRAMDAYSGPSHSGSDGAIDTLQRTLRCCGLSDYEDWWRTPYGEASGAPPSCCVNATDCAASALGNVTSASAVVYHQGCFTLVTGFMQQHLTVIAGCAFGIAFSQVFGMVLSCCLARHINANQYEMV
ncbi:tetraspanin-7 [Lampetra fluviatilis]